MRPLAALFLLLAYGSAQGALNTDGLPSGAVAVVGVDIAAFQSTKVGQALEKFSGLKAKNIEASRKLREKLGIDSAKDLTDIVVGIYPGPDGKIAEKNATGVVLIRGKFQPNAIESFATKNGIPSKPVGKHVAWEAGPFIEKVVGEKPKDGANDAYIVATSASTIVMASKELLERTLNAIDHGEKASLLPEAVSTKFAGTPKSWIHLYVDVTKISSTKADVGAETFYWVTGEDATDLRIASVADFVSPEKASTLRKQLAGLQALASIGLSNAEGKSAEQKEDQALLLQLVQKVRIGGEGKQATLDLDFPADKAAQVLSKAIEKAQNAPNIPPASK